MGVRVRARNQKVGDKHKEIDGAGLTALQLATRSRLEGKEFLFSDRGETALKGFEDAVRLYEVRWRD